MGGQVDSAKEAALLDVEGFELLSDVIPVLVASVEAVGRSLELLLTTTVGDLLLLNHAAQRDRQPGMPVLISGVQQVQRGGDDVLERLRTISHERDDAQIHDRGHGSHLHVPVAGDPVLHIPVDRLLRKRGPTLTAQGLHFVVLGIEDQQGDLSADGAGKVVGDVEREDGGGCGVGRIASLLEDCDAGLDGTGATGRDGARLAHCLPAFVLTS